MLRFIDFDKGLRGKHTRVATKKAGVDNKRIKKPPPFGEGLNFGGAKRDRTADLLHAMQALSQLSYSPTCDFTDRTLLGSEFGGAKRDRTADLLHAMQALSQLSYSPNVKLSC